ncbi:thermonuclease family protein [Helicobacter sp. 23-1044]
MKNFALLVAFIIANLVSNLCAIDGIPERKYLLNSYYNPNRLVFRLSKYSFECSMLGASVPYFSAKNPCNNEKFRIMSHLTIGYMQNNLNLEQMYSVRVVNGYCLIAYSNALLNEKMVADGFAVVNKDGVDSAFLEKMLHLQNLAQERKAGLWNSFYNEMQCFSESYK